jgi:hypothetical protein
MFPQNLYASTRIFFAPDGGGGGGGDAAAAAAAAAAKTAEDAAIATAATAAAKAKRAEQTFSGDYVHELREEAKALRLAAQAETVKREAADAAAIQARANADKAKTDAKAEADQRIIRSELKALALAAGIVDPDGLQFVDLTKLKLGDKGELEGGDAAIKALKEAKPYLFGTAKGSSDPHKTPKPGESEPKSAKDMDEKEYKVARAAITGVPATGRRW